MTFIDLYKEFYYISALPKEKKAKYYLIQRYQDKVSPRLKQEALELIKEGEKLHMELLSGLIMSAGSIMKMIPKDDTWQGSKIPIPFKV